jgi:hypothetical protein
VRYICSLESARVDKNNCKPKVNATNYLLLGSSSSKWTAYEFRYLWIVPINILGYFCFALWPYFPRLHYIWRFNRKRLQRIRYDHESSFRLRSLSRKLLSLQADIGLTNILSSGGPLKTTDFDKETKSLLGNRQGHYYVL